MRHGQRAQFVLMRVLIGFTLDLPARAARSDRTLGVLPTLGIGVAALDDEIGNDAMKTRPVVEPAVGELLEVGDRVRGVLVERLGDEGAFGGNQRCSRRGFVGAVRTENLARGSQKGSKESKGSDPWV